MTDQGDAPLGGGRFDFGSLLSQLGQVRQNIEQAQADAASESVEGTSGGGTVRITLSGAMDVLAVSIDPSVVDPAEVDMLEDLVLAAVRDGLEKAAGLAGQSIRGAVLPGLGGGGVDGPAGLGDLLGGFLGAGPAEGLTPGEADDDAGDGPDAG